MTCDAKLLKLSSLCKINYGKDHKKLDDGDIPAYGSGGILRYVDTALCTRKSVLIPRKGTLDNLFFATEPFWTVDTLFWTDIDDSKIIPEYLYYQLLTKNLAELNVGTAVPSLTTKILSDIEIRVPGISEQQKAVSVLCSIDHKIKLNKHINHNLEQQAQALYATMFTNNIRSKMTSSTLSDIATIVMGQSPSGSSYNEDGNGEVFYQGRADFGLRFPSRRLYTTEPKRIAEAGDVLLSVRAPVGDVNVAYERCCIGRGLGAVRSKDENSSFLLYTMFALKHHLNLFNKEGTVFGSINHDSLNNVLVNIPSSKDVAKFEAIVHPMDDIIRTNYEEIRNLQSLRDLLLPKLMSGEIDTSNIKI